MIQDKSSSYAHFINVTAVKTVIRERIKKKNGKKKKSVVLCFFQREITLDAHGQLSICTV